MKKVSTYSTIIAMLAMPVLPIAAPVVAAFGPFDAAPSSGWAMFNGPVFATAEDPVNRIVYVGGMFSSADGNTRHNIAAVDMDTGALLPFDADVNSFVWDLELSPDGSTLYAAGGFASVNQGTSPETRRGVAAFDTVTGTVTAFDAGIMETLSGYNVAYTYELELTADGSLLYVGGVYNFVNGSTPRNSLAAFDAATGAATAFDAGLSGTTGPISPPLPFIYGLELTADESVLYVGGMFTTANGSVTRRTMAAFTTADGVVTPFNPDVVGGTWYSPISIDLSGDESTVYAAGVFTGAAGGAVARNNAASFDATTGSVTSFDPSPGGFIYEIKEASPTTVYLGGTFGVVNGSVIRNKFAEVDSSTGAATSYDLQVIGSEIRTIEPTAEALYVGGSFYSAGCVGVQNLARMAAGSASSSCSTPTPTPTPSPTGDYKNILTFSLQTLGQRAASFTGIEGTELRVYDVSDEDFISLYGKNYAQWNSRLHLIYNSDIGKVSWCTTDFGGACTAEKSAAAEYLVVGQYADTTNDMTVYISKQERGADFDVHKESYVDLKVVRKYDKDGAVEYGPAGQVVVVGGVPFAAPASAPAAVAPSPSGSNRMASLGIAAFLAALGVGIYTRAKRK